MPRVYELPTHLQVEDQLIAGLTARQLLRLMIGASLAYGLWDQAGWVPQEIRLALAAILVVTGVLFALLQPGGRPVDQWLLAVLLFVLLPRRLVWRPGTTLVRELPRQQAGWAELELHPQWLGTETGGQTETARAVSRRPSVFWRFDRVRALFSKPRQNRVRPRRRVW